MEEVFEAEKLNCIRNKMTHMWGTACATLGGSALLFDRHLRCYNSFSYGKFVFC